MKLSLVLIATLACGSDASAMPKRPGFLALRGGSEDKELIPAPVEGRRSNMLIAQKMPKLPPLAKVVDTVLAGSGLAGTFALMGALEGKFAGVKLFVPPMMASGIIFFSPANPPSPRGFLSGTVGCASVCAGVFTLLTGMAGVSPAAASGCAAGALLMWYKATNCIFPPAAVLCVLMSGMTTSSYAFVARTWLAGHACLYAGALGVSAIRSQARMSLGKAALSKLGGLSTEELKKIFAQFDLSKDGSLDATELKCALKAALGADLSMQEVKKLVASVDNDGNGEVDFNEFKIICKAKAE